MKYDWAPVARQQRGGAFALAATEPETVAKSLEPVMGRDVASLVKEQLAAELKRLGIDKIDRRHLAIPGANNGDAASVARENCQRFSVHDLTLRRHVAEGSDQWHRKMDLMAGYFRTLLFGVPVSQSIGEVDEHMVRVLSSTDPAGGYLIPPGFIPELVRDIPKLSQLYQYVRRIPVGNDTGQIPKVGANAQVFWGEENVEFEQGDPSFGQDTYAIHRMNALVMLSREIANDSNPGIVATVISLFQEAMAEERDRVIAIGTGSGRPLGLYSATGITDVNVTTLTYTNLVKLKESIDQRYLNSPSLRWQMNQNVKAYIEGSILDLQGQPIFKTGNPNGSMPSTILNVPYSIEAAFPNNYIGIGDLRYYLWFDREMVGMESSTEAGDAFKKHQMHIKFWERADGKPVTPVKKPFARSRLITGVTSLT